MFAHTFLTVDEEHAELKMKSLGEKPKSPIFGYYFQLLFNNIFDSKVLVH